MSEVTTNPHTKDSIRNLLATNDRAVERAIIRLYERQTASEQECGDTINNNGEGFDAASARTGTYCAHWIISGRRLSGPFLERCRRITIRHAGQLVEIANRPRE